MYCEIFFELVRKRHGGRVSNFWRNRVPDLDTLIFEASLQFVGTVTCIGAGSRVPGGAQAPPELFLAPPEPLEPPLTIEKIMH